MPNKILSFADIGRIHDKKWLKTHIEFRNSFTGELIFEGTNKVILPGAAFIARKLFNLNVPEVTPSYNTALNLDNTVYTTPDAPEKVFLFCVGIDGCGRENSQVWAEDYGKWIMPESLVPFQYKPQSKDISDSLKKSLYFGRKTELLHYAYYFKAFESDPVLVQQYIDGTPIDSTVYSSTNTTEIETYVELRMKVTKDDCRDYFIATTGINDARINTISLLTGWAKEIDGFNVYQDVRPLTKLNFPNEPLIDLLKGIDIIYQVYF